MEKSKGIPTTMISMKIHSGDVKGMLELYEAAQFQPHGENILEEALSFSTFHLKFAETTVNYPFSIQIANALKRPIRKSVPRLIARSYISIYEACAKWLHENCIPTMEEYMSIALVSSGYWLITISSFAGMEESITKETFNWAFNDPKIIIASSIICRLMSDIVGHKVEQERGHASSAVECYMKQYGVSIQEPHDELYKLLVL
ncbi:hypothetical protein Golax_025475 [Gossypium laxum]|uniref:Terpene synthase metal-binding domain-containing protein n=1 Tax=Gossypium laxum TaxID=34288 RepID=A0A7J9B286_9ROSI|nr:hypothetical protein [Gossypium laxum]